jgi:hypothetical protein
MTDINLLTSRSARSLPMRILIVSSRHNNRVGCWTNNPWPLS